MQGVCLGVRIRVNNYISLLLCEMAACGKLCIGRAKLPSLEPMARVTERFYLYGDGSTADTGDECLTDADIDHVPSTTRDLSSRRIR